MTNKKRFLMALTVVSFLTVTGFVVGCDSDDTPTVTPPSGGGSGTTPTRNTTAETQGREGLEETDNGSMIRNTGEVALNVRFAYDPARHYRLNVNTAMPSDPASAGTAPARVACGVPATGRANGQCFDNDTGVETPKVYSSNGNGDNGNGEGEGEVFKPRTVYWGVVAFGSNNARWGWSIQSPNIEPGEVRANTAGTFNIEEVWRLAKEKAMREARAWCRDEIGDLADCRFLDFGQELSLQRRVDDSTCGAVAHGTRTIPTLAAGRGSSRQDAQNIAIAACRNKGGENCYIPTGSAGEAWRCLPVDFTG